MSTNTNGLTAEQLDLLPTEAEVQFFEAHGWFRTRRLFSDEYLDSLIDASDRHFAGERDWELPISQGFSNWTPTSRDEMRNAQATAHQNAVLRSAALHPLLGAVAARLTRSTSVRYFDDSVLYKPGGAIGDDTVVGWHTDRAYWGTCSSENMLTAWMPFQDTTREMGALTYLDGSHLWGGAELHRNFYDRTRAAADLAPRRDAAIVERVMDLRRGEVSFHNCRVVHGSGPNRSARPRRAMAIHFQDEANQFVEAVDTAGRPWHLFNDDLARRLDDGRPDYSDPAWFPVVWPVSAGAPAR